MRDEEAHRSWKMRWLRLVEGLGRVRALGPGRSPRRRRPAGELRACAPGRMAEEDRISRKRRNLGRQSNGWTATDPGVGWTKMTVWVLLPPSPSIPKRTQISY